MDLTDSEIATIMEGIERNLQNYSGLQLGTAGHLARLRVMVTIAQSGGNARELAAAKANLALFQVIAAGELLTKRLRINPDGSTNRL